MFSNSPAKIHNQSVCECDCMKVFISHIIIVKCCTLLKKKADLHVYCIRLNKVNIDFDFMILICRFPHKAPHVLARIPDMSSYAYHFIWVRLFPKTTLGNFLTLRIDRTVLICRENSGTSATEDC